MRSSPLPAQPHRPDATRRRLATRRTFTAPAVIAALAVIATLAACSDKRSPAPTTASTPNAAPVETEPRPAAAWIPLPPTAWVRLDLTALRADPRLAARGADAAALAPIPGMAKALDAGSELFVAFLDPAFALRVQVVRGPVDRDALFADLRSRGPATGGTWDVEAVGRTKVWHQGSTGWSLAAPDAQTLITGVRDAVRELVGLADRRSQWTPPAIPEGELISMGFVVSAAHRMMAPRLLRDEAALLLVQAIREGRGAVTAQGPIVATLHLTLEPGAPAAPVAQLVDAIVRPLLAELTGVGEVGDTLAVTHQDAATGGSITLRFTPSDAMIAAWQTTGGSGEPDPRPIEAGASRP